MTVSVFAMANVSSGPAGIMDGAFCLERESALGGLFQQIINEMKVSFYKKRFFSSCKQIIISTQKTENIHQVGLVSCQREHKHFVTLKPVF